MTKDQQRKERVKQKLEYYDKQRSEYIESLSGQVKRSKKPAVAGTIVLTPIIVTIYIITWLLGIIEGLPGTEILQITKYQLLNDLFMVAGVLIGGAIAVTATGRIVQTQPGFQVEKITDQIIEQIPFLGKIYSIVKISADTVLTGTEDFKEPVKIDFNGLRLTAYKTGNTTEDGREIVFLPTSPNISTGFVIEAKPEQLEETDENVSQALTRTLSAGFGTPKNKEDQKRTQEKQNQ